MAKADPKEIPVVTVDDKNFINTSLYLRQSH